MDLEGSMFSKISHTEKDKYYMISLCMWNLKNNTNTTKQKQIHRYREEASGYQWGREGGRSKKRVED